MIALARVICNFLSSRGAHFIPDHEVQVHEQQYTNFLNAVDPQGTNPDSIYSARMGNFWGGITNTGSTDGSRYAVRNDMGNKPVNYVSRFDAARVSNWLQAGGGTYLTSTSGSAAINSGAYTLNGATSGNAPPRLTRIVSAAFWHSSWGRSAYLSVVG